MRIHYTEPISESKSQAVSDMVGVDENSLACNVMTFKIAVFDYYLSVSSRNSMLAL